MKAMLIALHGAFMLPSSLMVKFPPTATPWKNYRLADVHRADRQVCAILQPSSEVLTSTPPGIMRLTLIGMLLALTTLPLQGQSPTPPRPPGVTDSAIASGKALFHGSANCSACHGVGGRGTEYGPAITGALWLHGPGTYESLIAQVKHGVPASRSATGSPMPMRGWNQMNDDDVKAVAAYVWSISHPPQPPPPS
jgi:mono/diheme cytochrome c family protein